MKYFYQSVLGCAIFLTVSCKPAASTLAQQQVGHESTNSPDLQGGEVDAYGNIIYDAASSAFGIASTVAENSFKTSGTISASQGAASTVLPGSGGLLQAGTDAGGWGVIKDSAIQAKNYLGPVAAAGASAAGSAAYTAGGYLVNGAGYVGSALLSPVAVGAAGAAAVGNQALGNYGVHPYELAEIDRMNAQVPGQSSFQEPGSGFSQAPQHGDYNSDGTQVFRDYWFVDPYWAPVN